jgi:tetratricopeptide (TPR) repeat protein
MNKSFLLITIFSVALVAALYSLPKIIVDNKKNVPKGTANRDVQVSSSPKKVEEDSHKDESSHVVELSATEQKQLNQLKANFIIASSNKKEDAGMKLIALYSSLQKYDSAGYYAESLAKLFPNEKNWLNTGDLYYQAFTYAVDEAKGVKLAEKSREYYSKALDKNPNLLLAKTNMAMTYVSSPTPMQGILLLREVVAQSPDFEPAVFNLGLLSMKSNQFAKAVERFKHITNNNPKNTKAAFYLGISLARLGRNEEAKEVLLKVKQLDKDEAVQNQIAEILNELK